MSDLATIEHTPDRVMVVCAHPDDAELGAGATLAKWIAAGAQVTIVVCTDGASGSSDRKLTSSDVVRLRRQEQQAAANTLGVLNLEMLDYPDGGLEDTAAFRGEIVRLIRRHRPLTLLTHDPTAHKHFAHRDHRIAGMVVQDAVYPYARDWLHYPEQLKGGVEPHKVRELLFWESDEPNVIVDISGYLEAQATALACHESQFSGLDTGSGSLEEWLAQRASVVADRHPIAAGETFRRMIAPT